MLLGSLGPEHAGDELVGVGMAPFYLPHVLFVAERGPDHIERLDLLKDDPTTLVRRSVANNLNDLGKVHCDLLTDTCRRWLKGASAERRALVEHALRGAVKRADPAARTCLARFRIAPEAAAHLARPYVNFRASAARSPRLR